MKITIKFYEKIKIYALYKTSMLSWIFILLYIYSSLKQQSVGGHVAPLGHIILIPSHQVCVLTRGEHANHYTTDTFEISQ